MTRELTPTDKAFQLKLTYIFLLLFAVKQVESLESCFHPIRHKLYKTSSELLPLRNSFLTVWDTSISFHWEVHFPPWSRGSCGEVSSWWKKIEPHRKYQSKIIPISSNGYPLHTILFALVLKAKWRTSDFILANCDNLDAAKSTNTLGEGCGHSSCPRWLKLLAVDFWVFFHITTLCYWFWMWLLSSWIQSEYKQYFPSLGTGDPIKQEWGHSFLLDWICSELGTNRELYVEVSNLSWCQNPLIIILQFSLKLHSLSAELVTVCFVNDFNSVTSCH